MRPALIAVVLSSVSGAVCAQSANETVTGLKTCFQLAHSADAICSNPASDAVQRFDCLQKARTAQLECLERIPPETYAGSMASGKTAGASGMPSGPAAALTELSTATVLPNKPATAVSPNPPAKSVVVSPKLPDANWIVSQTTSPVDYTPLIAAAIRLPFSVEHAPSTFAIRCHGQRTELLVRTEGTWRASRRGEVQVDYQINDQLVVRRAWTASADGKTASYTDDPVGLLRSLPEGARLKISVLDGPGPGHQATFQLSGLDIVREKLAAACKWAPAANKVAVEKR
jgi:hypothetical protein